ncbi:hypothetical protein AVEN_125369-1 [Araneus ventricosus]|uniref:Uncharacterized protein n=1 Tax=Araneus ventricosus TaxID=182803 RepID=A0A4Y2TCL9_ARAVE|nr:hypothetical protein AVEN_125369-1 [Araneus ventricosus]
MMEQEIPDMDSLIQSPSKDEMDNEIEIVCTHPSPFDKVAKKTSAVLHKIRATLAKANAAEIGTLQARIALLEAKVPEFNALKEQDVALKAENAVLVSPFTAPSYANALKRVPPSKSKAKNVSLVFVKNKDTSSEEVKETLLKALAPSKNETRIRNVKNLAKGGVAIESDSVKGTESLLKEINSN